VVADEQVAAAIGIEVDSGYLNGSTYRQFLGRPETALPIAFKDPETLAVDGSQVGSPIAIPVS
jgi:hypothetical protein